MLPSTAEEKRHARLDVGHAVASGKLLKLPCAECGSEPAQAHHHDYSKPLDVVWLCVTHHNDIHLKHARSKNCEVCGENFTPHRTKRARQKTCSWECRNKLIGMRASKRYEDPEERARAREIALRAGAAERAKTLVLYRWGKRK